MDSSLRDTLVANDQAHLLTFWDELSAEERNSLTKELAEIDWDLISELTETYVVNRPETHIPSDLAPAPFFALEPKDKAQQELYAKAESLGKELLGQGKVAALTVAGGQGTRLGFDGPKGTYPITPVKSKTFFQYFAESIARVGEKYGKPLTWYIMTSILNDAPTQAFFQENDFFGLDPEQVMFFPQGTMPAIGYDRKLLLASKSGLALAPNGHGGTLLALRTSGALERMASEGVEYISYFQIDNALVSVADPLFVGLHALEESEMSARMLAKTNPYEKLGNFCVSEGRLNIIEYSDLPDELAEKRNDDGTLEYLAGSPAIHVLSRKFVEDLTAAGKLQLPWHRADKKVAFVNQEGDEVKPETPNAVKLETFIFDALPLASRTMVLEARREDEFAPTKNPTGVDSVESCQQMLVDRDARWLEAAGVCVPRKDDNTPNCLVELSPRTFIDVEDVVHSSKELQSPAPGEEMYYE